MTKKSTGLLSFASCERVQNMAFRIVTQLKQREFTAQETSALILCLQSLLDVQLANADTKKNVESEK